MTLAIVVTFVLSIALALVSLRRIMKTQIQRVFDGPTFGHVQMTNPEFSPEFGKPIPEKNASIVDPSQSFQQPDFKQLRLQAQT